MTDVYDPKDPNLVYLRPGNKERPIKYMENIEQQGMLIDGKYQIAMYVSGVQGPAGVDLQSDMDTIIASCSDEDSPLTVGGPKTTFRAPYALDLTTGHVRISLTNAPTGAPLIVDLTMNGTTVFSTLLQIDAGSKTSVGASVAAVLSVTSVPDDAEFMPYITQIGSTYAGSGLKIAVTGKKV